MREEEALDEELDPGSKLREYVDSKRRLVAKKLCYARPTCRSWPLKQGSMGDISQLLRRSNQVRFCTALFLKKNQEMMWVLSVNYPAF